MSRVQVRYKQTTRGYVLRGLREIAIACNVPRHVIVSWIRDEEFPVAIVPIEDSRGAKRVVATTYGLIDTWLFARYLASRPDVLRVLDDVSITEPADDDAA